MMASEIHSKISHIISENFFGEHMSLISESASLISLGIDSVALMTLFVLLEEEFGIVVEEEDIFMDIEKMCDLVNYVVNKIGGK